MSSVIKSLLVFSVLCDKNLSRSTAARKNGQPLLISLPNDSCTLTGQQNLLRPEGISPASFSACGGSHSATASFPPRCCLCGVSFNRQDAVSHQIKNRQLPESPPRKNHAASDMPRFSDAPSTEYPLYSPVF